MNITEGIYKWVNTETGKKSLLLLDRFTFCKGELSFPSLKGPFRLAKVSLTSFCSRFHSGRNHTHYKL